MINILTDDVKKVNNAPFIPWTELKGSTIYITGATGLIGRALVKSLLYANSQRHLELHLILLVRDLDRAMAVFKDYYDEDIFHFVVGSVEEAHCVQGPIDYMIHCASQTASKELPVHDGGYRREKPVQ